VQPLVHVWPHIVLLPQSSVQSVVQVCWHCVPMSHCVSQAPVPAQLTVSDEPGSELVWQPPPLQSTAQRELSRQSIWQFPVPPHVNVQIAPSAQFI
jgi:hypothetical protein